MIAWSRRLIGVVLIGVLGIGAPLQAAPQKFVSGIDANSDGALDIEEFVLAMAKRDYGRLDANKDAELTVAEWTAVGGQWQRDAAKRFNADGDDIMSADELVELYSWIFGNRDADKSGALTPAEAPRFFMQS